MSGNPPKAVLFWLQDQVFVAVMARLPTLSFGYPYLMYARRWAFMSVRN